MGGGERDGDKFSRSLRVGGFYAGAEGPGNTRVVHWIAYMHDAPVNTCWKPTSSIAHLDNRI